MAVCIKEVNGTIHLEIRVQPRSSRNQILGEQEGFLRVKLTAPPVEGEANQALLDFMASQLHTSRKNLSILRGSNARQKLLEIRSLGRDEVLARLGLLPE